MGMLVLVRHGQASFLAENYDRLSELGERQSRLLGEYWAARKVQFDAAFTGPRARHLRTAELVTEVIRKHGAPWPEPTLLPEIDEYEWEDVMKKTLPGLVMENEEVREMMQAFHESNGQPDAAKKFHKMFAAVMAKWVKGEVQPDGVEPWRTFTGRVNTGLSSLMQNNGRGRRIVAFTSGGPISVALQRALGIDDPNTLEMAWAVRNAALTEFLFSEGRFTLNVFNATPHLDDPVLLTYR